MELIINPSRSRNQSLAERKRDNNVVREMMQIVLTNMGVPHEDPMSRSRKRSLADARKIVMTYLRFNRHWTYQRIADSWTPAFDHTSVISAVNAFQDTLAYMREAQRTWKEVGQQLEDVGVRVDNMEGIFYQNTDEPRAMRINILQR